MSNWYYYNANDEKVGPVSATALKDLARQGFITRETKIENTNGRTAVAGQVNGLTFAETKQVETPPPVETEFYGFASSTGGFDFPGLTSEGPATADYDPFANTAPVAPHALPPSKQPSTLTKPVVLIPACIGGGMVLMFLMMLPFTTIFGSMKERPRVGNSVASNKSIEAKEPFANAAQQSSGIVLKEPLPKDEYVQTLEQKLTQTIKEEMEKANARDIENNIRPVYTNSDPARYVGPHVRLTKSSWDTANNVYSILKDNKDKDLLSKIAALQNGYAICMAEIATQWNHGIRSSNDWFGPEVAITSTVGVYTSNNCYNNLEQIMAAITARVKTLNKEKYANTIKLYSILSKYKKSVTAPSGSLKAYTENMAAYQEEFTQTMSLAELEW